MKILLKNGLILPMTREDYYLNGSVLVEDGKITAIGDVDSSKLSDVYEIDCERKIIMPSLINTHTHLSMGYMRNYYDSEPELMSWLSKIFPIEDRLTNDDIYWGSMLGLLEQIKSGCVLSSDMYFKQPYIARAAKDARIKLIFGVTLFGDLEESKKRIATIEKDIVPLLDDNIAYSIAPHAIYTTTAESYKYGYDYATANDVLFHTHLSETTTELNDCIKEHGTTPLIYLEKLGLFRGARTVIAHGVHLTDIEMDMAAEMGISVAHNASSNMKLNSGIAKIATMTERGINVSLGTDGSSSNNTLDMISELHTASLLNRLTTVDPGMLTPYQMVKCATINGAKALGVDKTTGSLEVGKDADIILLDTDTLHNTPLNNPFSALCYSMKSEDVDTVLCRGNILMKGRKLYNIDEDYVKNKIRNLWKKLEA